MQDSSEAMGLIEVAPDRAASGGGARSAASLLSAGRDGAMRAMRGQQERLAGRLDRAAEAVRRAGGRYEGRQNWLAGAIGQGATELDKVAASVRDKDVEEFIAEVGRFARRNRAAFAGASLLAGFALTRLIKLAAASGGTAQLSTAEA